MDQDTGIALMRSAIQHDRKVRELEQQLGLMRSTLAAQAPYLEPLRAMRSNDRDRAIKEQHVERYRAGRADDAWQERLSGTRWAQHTERKHALDRAIRTAMTIRDNAPDVALRDRAQAEINRLAGMARA
jgi:hypothetical protein